MKKIGIVMGSKSDLPVVQKAIDTLNELEIPFEAHIYSAHRTPAEAADFARTAREKDFGVILAFAGMAAHLAGAIAANTTLPVIGIPCKGGALDGLDALDVSIAIIKNVNSRKMGKKDIIKVDADIPIDLDIIGFVDPGATVNIIKDDKLVDKKTIEMPELLHGVVRCKNPRCITSTEQELAQLFRLTDRENKVYRCVYCETKAQF